MLTKEQKIVIAYRNYYKKHKMHIASWKNREVPSFYEEQS